MLRLILIRPGSTEYDQQGRVQGTLDVPLNEDGRREIDRTIDSLGGEAIEALYTSPGQATEETAGSIAQALELKVKRLEKMRNLDHGLWQGMLIEDVKVKQPKIYKRWQENPENVCPPEGEMLSDARERIQAVLAKLVKKHKDGTIGLVVPEPLASLVCNVVRQDKLGDLWQATEGGRWETIVLGPATLVAATGSVDG